MSEPIYSGTDRINDLDKVTEATDTMNFVVDHPNGTTNRMEYQDLFYNSLLIDEDGNFYILNNE